MKVSVHKLAKWLNTHKQSDSALLNPSVTAASCPRCWCQPSQLPTSEAYMWERARSAQELAADITLPSLLIQSWVWFHWLFRECSALTCQHHTDKWPCCFLALFFSQASVVSLWWQSRLFSHVQPSADTHGAAVTASALAADHTDSKSANMMLISCLH